MNRNWSPSRRQAQLRLAHAEREINSQAPPDVHVYIGLSAKTFDPVEIQLGRGQYARARRDLKEEMRKQGWKSPKKHVPSCSEMLFEPLLKTLGVWQSTKHFFRWNSVLCVVVGRAESADLVDSVFREWSEAEANKGVVEMHWLKEVSSDEAASLRKHALLQEVRDAKLLAMEAMNPDELAEYQKSKAQHLCEAIDTCTANIAAIVDSKEGIKDAKVDLVEVMEHVGGGDLLKRLLEFRNTLEVHSRLFDTAARQKVSSSAVQLIQLIQQLQHMQQAPAEFTYQGKDIITLLEDLLSDFKESEANMDQDDFDLESVFEKKALGDYNQKKFAQDEKGEKSALAEEKSNSVADAREAIDEEASDRKADQTFLDTLTAECENKAKLFDQHSWRRSDELSAMTQVSKMPLMQTTPTRIGAPSTVQGTGLVSYGPLLETPKRVGAPYPTSPTQWMSPSPGHVTAAPAMMVTPSRALLSPSSDALMQGVNVAVQNHGLARQGFGAGGVRTGGAITRQQILQHVKSWPYASIHRQAERVIMKHVQRSP